MNDDSGYQALTNLYTLSVDDINVPTLTTQNLFVDNAYIVNDTVTNLIFQSATGTQLNLTNFSTVNFSASTGYIAQIGCQGITGANGYLTNMRWEIATGTTGFISTVAGNLCSYNNGRFPNLTGNIGYCNTFSSLSMSGSTGFFQSLAFSNATGGNQYINNQTFVNATGTSLAFSNATGSSLFSTNFRYQSATGGALAVSSLNSSGDISLVSSGVDSEIRILTSDNRISKLSLKEFSNDYGFEASYNGSVDKYFLQRRNITLSTVFEIERGTGLTTFTPPVQINNTLQTSGNISLVSSGVDSEIKILTSDNRVSKLSLKEFTDSYGFEVFYNGATNNLNLNRRNNNNVNIYTTSVIDGFTNYNAPVQFSLGMSGSTGIFGHIATNSLTGNTGFVNSLAYLSSTGNTGFVNSLGYLSSTGNIAFCNTFGAREVFGITGNFNIVKASINLESPLATINQLNSSTGTFSNYLEADNRVVNNYELCRSISRFYPENYYAGVSSPAYTDPLVFPNNFQNGLIISDTSFQSLVYMPARDTIVIPNGQPVYYNMTATINSSFISNIGTNMPSNLMMPLSFNRTYIFIFNAVTSLYEYQGFINNFQAPTARQFNSRANSFTLPPSRPNPNNLLSALSSGVTEWTDDISIRNFACTGANIGFLNTSTMTGTNGFISNLNTSDTRLHLGNFAAELTQGNLGIALGAEAGRSNQAQNCIAIGYRAGNNNQGISIGSSIAIGGESGQTSQRTNAIALGILCGRTSQREGAISIGYFAGNLNQNQNSIAIGNNAGSTTQSSSSVAIGHNAGSTSQGIQSIAIGLDSGKCNQNSNSIAIGMQAAESNQQGTTISIGFQSGQTSQQLGSICIGDRAGQTTQQSQAIAIGTLAGGSVQGTGAVAIGYLSGQTRQSAECIAIGYEAGNTSQGNDSIAIGYRAGYLNQHAQTIVMNAGVSALNTLGTGRCYINPIRLTNRTTAMRDLYYDPVISELTYSTFQDEIGGPIAIGGVYVTLFAMAGNANYLLSINTRANDGNYGLFICYQEEGANGLVVALNQNNILIQTVAGSNVQIRTVNAATYNFYYSARRLL